MKKSNYNTDQTPAGEIELFRRWIGWSREHLAEWLGISEETVRNYELGRTLPPVAIIYLLRVCMRKGINDIGGPCIESEVFRPIKGENKEK